MVIVGLVIASLRPASGYTFPVVQRPPPRDLLKVRAAHNTSSSIHTVKPGSRVQKLTFSAFAPAIFRASKLLSPPPPSPWKLASLYASPAYFFTPGPLLVLTKRAALGEEQLGGVCVAFGQTTVLVRMSIRVLHAGIVFFSSSADSGVHGASAGRTGEAFTFESSAL